MPTTAVLHTTVKPRGRLTRETTRLIAAAEAEGFELCWRPVGGTLCVGFVRGDDLRFPAFGEERLATRYMADWLRRGRMFA